MYAYTSIYPYIARYAGVFLIITPRLTGSAVSLQLLRHIGKWGGLTTGCSRRCSNFDVFRTTSQKRNDIHAKHTLDFGFNFALRMQMNSELHAFSADGQTCIIMATTWDRKDFHPNYSDPRWRSPVSSCSPSQCGESSWSDACPPLCPNRLVSRCHCCPEQPGYDVQRWNTSHCCLNAHKRIMSDIITSVILFKLVHW